MLLGRPSGGNAPLDAMKSNSAIVHYWFVTRRGGERVVEAIGDLMPEADLFAHVADPSVLHGSLKGRTITTTAISSLPGAVTRYQKYLPVMPWALEQLDLSGRKLVVSSESGPAKGVVTDPDCLHVCYCHSPMRYVWDLYPEYARTAGALTRLMMRPLVHYLKIWDHSSASRPDHVVANSRFVASRIRKSWGRESQVIYPPVCTEDFQVVPGRGEAFLVLGQLVDYKRADLAVRAFNQLGLPLDVIGEGAQFELLRKIAGPNVRILGSQPFPVVKQALETCRALVFPGIEDFGIVPVEAMACGRPVIGLGRGGLLETMIRGKTGVLFQEQSIEAIVAAVGEFLGMEDSIDRSVLRSRAEEFDQSVFRSRFRRLLSTAWEEHADRLGLVGPCPGLAT